ncbi:MAG: peptide chain release factor 1 [Candidatus Pacebacteria bacterium]|nr:peptide chain release factor 1 [Candidatus Paceibacterota bacterium]
MDLSPHIENAAQRRREVEQALAEFDFNAPDADHKTYENLSREYQRLQKLLSLWDEKESVEKERADNQDLLDSEEDSEFLELVRTDLESLTGRIDSLNRQIKALLLPPHPNEQRNTIVEIRPAAGGDEAGLFAADLLRMYSRLAEQRGWRLEVLDLSENDLGGIKNVAFSLQGGDVYRLMKFESGVHRVQRIPVTESGGRIHTSTVTVAVLPEAEEVDLKISPEEIRVDVFRSSGPGGQSVNTTDSAVRITHIPTGLVVSSQQEKSQHRNKEIAMRILRSRLLEHKQAEEAAKSAAARREQVGTGDRSERIRTYNFPQNRVTDHRFNISRHDLTDILEGKLSELLDELAAAEVERQLEAQVT